MVYILISLLTELIAYGILVGLCANITNEYYGSISSISSGVALSSGINSYFTFIIFVFSAERNGYEFFIDPYDRLVAWRTNKGLYIAIWIRIIFLNLLMLFLLLISTIDNNRDSTLHNIYSICAIVFYIFFEFTCIGIRSYYASISYLEIVKSKLAYIGLLCLEAVLVLVTIFYALCFISLFETCPPNSAIVYVSEYLMFGTIISTPVFRFLD